jgi:tetratricopeptide (TPR) repeat protein
MKALTPACLLLANLLGAQELPTLPVQPREAMALALEQSQKAYPGNSSRLLDLARWYLLLPDEARAEAALEGALKADGSDVDTQIAALRVWLDQGRRDKAQVLAEKALQHPSLQKKNALCKLACACVEAGFPALAERAMELAWGKDPMDSDNCLDFGRACLKARLPDRAAFWFQRALLAKPKGEIWFEVAEAYGKYLGAAK